MGILGRVAAALVTAVIASAGMALISPTASAMPDPSDRADLCGTQSYRVAADAFVMFMKPVDCVDNNAYAFNYDRWYYPAPPELWGTVFQGADSWAVGAGMSNTCAVAFAAPDADMAQLTEAAARYFSLPLCPFDGVTLDEQQNLVHQSIGKSGECDATHGWLASWQEWANDGKGGPVCERTLLYSNDAGDYVVGLWSESANKYVPWEGASV